MSKKGSVVSHDVMVFPLLLLLRVWFFFLHAYAGGRGFTGSLYVVRNRGLSLVGFNVQIEASGENPTADSLAALLLCGLREAISRLL